MPRPSILFFMGSKFKHSLVLPKIISEFISIIIVKLFKLLCFASSSASQVEPSYNSPSLIITKSQIDDLVGILRKGIVMATEDIKKEGLY